MVERGVHIDEVGEQNTSGLSQETLVGKMRKQETRNHALNYHPILTRAQEQMIFRDLRTGNDKTSVFMQSPEFPQFIEEIAKKDGEKWAYVLAGNETITGVIAACNYRLVVGQAQKYMGRNRPVEDMLRGGTEGLFRAIGKFDPDKGTKFSTYALWQIKSGIQKASREHDGISGQVYQGIGKASRIWEAYIAIFKREPTRKEMHQQMFVHTEFSTTRIEEILDRRPSTSLDKIILKERNTDTNKLLRDDSVDVAEKAIENIEQEKRIHTLGDAIERQLDPDERTVLWSTFGFGENEKKSLEEIAQENNFNINEVRSLLKTALMKLQGDQQMQDLGKAEGFTHTKTDVKKEVKRKILKQGVIYTIGPKESIPQFDDTSPLIEKVKHLRLQNYNNQQIVEILGVPQGRVRHAAEKLMSYSEILPINIARKKTREQERAAARSSATDAVGKYLKEHPALFLGKVPKRRKQRTPQTIALDEKVKELRETTELTNQQIAQQLEISRTKVDHSLKRLRASGNLAKKETVKKKEKRKPETIVFDNKVKTLKKGTNRTHRQIAEELGVNYKKIKNSVERLRASGENSWAKQQSKQ